MSEVDLTPDPQLGGEIRDWLLNRATKSTANLDIATDGSSSEADRGAQAGDDLYDF